jgi:hypothetical protein
MRQVRIDRQPDRSESNQSPLDRYASTAQALVTNVHKIEPGPNASGVGPPNPRRSFPLFRGRVAPAEELLLLWFSAEDSGQTECRPRLYRPSNFLPSAR